MNDVPLEPRPAFREATDADHPALLALEGSAPQAGAGLLQARRDFFARARAYPVWRVVVAEHEGRVVGAVAMALNAVRVGGEICQGAYLFNLRIAPALQRRGLGPRFMLEAWRWAAAGGARFCTGLILTSNQPSLKMTAALGYAFPARFDYLIVPLGPFEPARGIPVREVDLAAEPLLAAGRAERAARHDFVPAFLEKELFAPPPEGSYAGSLTAACAGGRAWLSIWDDRLARGLDPHAFRAVKGFDLSVDGPRGGEALASLLAALRRRGLDTLLLPLSREDPAHPRVAPFAAERLEFQFVLKPLDDAGAPGGRPVYFDVRH